MPVLGTVFVLGYELLLMRTFAWESDVRLPSFDRPASIASRGLDGLLVNLVWFAAALPLLIIYALAYSAARSAGLWSAPPWWLGLMVFIVFCPLGVVIDVAMLRTAVWMKPTAGMSLRGLRVLVRRCPLGFKRVAILSLALYALTYSLNTIATIGPLHSVIQLHWLTRTAWSALVAISLAPLSLLKSVAYGMWGADTHPGTWPPLKDIRHIEHPSIHDTWAVPAPTRLGSTPVDGLIQAQARAFREPPGRGAMLGWLDAHPKRVTAVLIVLLAVPWIVYARAAMSMTILGDPLPVAVRGSMLVAVALIAVGLALFAGRHRWARAQDTPFERMGAFQVGALGVGVCLAATSLPALALAGWLH